MICGLLLFLADVQDVDQSESDVEVDNVKKQVQEAPAAEAVKAEKAKDDDAYFTMNQVTFYGMMHLKLHF